MTPLAILLAAVFLATGELLKQFFQNRLQELFPPIIISMFVMFKGNLWSVIEIFYDTILYLTWILRLALSAGLQVIHGPNIF